MSKVLLDCNTKFPFKRRLEGALTPFVDADLPLVLELTLVTKRTIRLLNAEKRGVDAVTDVLSFPAANFRAGEPILSEEFSDCVEPVFGMKKGEWVLKSERLLLGSVVICTKRAKEQAKEYGHSEEREMCYLAVHGFLHCLGYDHITEEDKRVMRHHEEEIMKKIGLGREA